MQPSTAVYRTVDEYISTFPRKVQVVLQKLRKTITKAAPGAEERISYQIPAFVLNGMLVFFAAHRNHIGFYPTPSGIKAFEKELKGYECSKGTVQFPLDKPIPLGLIARIVKFRVKENLERGRQSTKRTKG
jgi:uncharacterized protein YdhG (YjbR/CyaY superfamily)